MVSFNHLLLLFFKACLVVNSIDFVFALQSLGFSLAKAEAKPRVLELVVCVLEEKTQSGREGGVMETGQVTSVFWGRMNQNQIKPCSPEYFFIALTIFSFHQQINPSYPAFYSRDVLMSSPL